MKKHPLSPARDCRRMTVPELLLYLRLRGLVRLARFDLERSRQCDRWRREALHRVDARQAQAHAIARRLGFTA